MRNHNIKVSFHAVWKKEHTNSTFGEETGGSVGKKIEIDDALHGASSSWVQQQQQLDFGSIGRQSCNLADKFLQMTFPWVNLWHQQPPQDKANALRFIPSLDRSCHIFT